MAKKKADLDDKIRALFGGAPKDFTAARNALAAELKKQGQAVESKKVKALKKPSAATALVNLVAQRYGADVKAMLSAGDAVEKAQRSGRTEDLHQHAKEHRSLIASLVEHAEAIADEVGINFTTAVRSKVDTAFRVASASDAERAAMAAGVLTRDLEATGFDALFEGGGIRAPKRTTASARTATKKRGDEKAIKAADAELKAAKKAQADLEEEMARLQKQLAGTTTRLERAQEKKARLGSS